MEIMKISNKDGMQECTYSFTDLSARLILSFSFSFSLLSWREVGGLYSSPTMICRELSTKASPDPKSKTMDTGLMSKLNQLLKTE